jgi:hypothetical protein
VVIGTDANRGSSSRIGHRRRAPLRRIGLVMLICRPSLHPFTKEISFSSISVLLVEERGFIYAHMPNAVSTIVGDKSIRQERGSVKEDWEKV